jgi:hypothetical protein
MVSQRKKTKAILYSYGLVINNRHYQSKCDIRLLLANFVYEVVMNGMAITCYELHIHVSYAKVCCKWQQFFLYRGHGDEE